MDGKTMKAGAIAGIKNFRNPISIARRVMERTPHVLLVGEGAELFAQVEGFQKESILTENSIDLYNDFIEGKGIIEREYDTSESMKLKERYWQSFEKQMKNNRLMEWYERYAKENHGTVNIIAQDMNGNISAGVSTSGLSFKLPGRVGDSPIIGAGNYADNRFGAAACVGVGEIAIRLSLARIAVYEMSKGKTAEEAGKTAISMIADLEEDAGSLAILVMDKKGEVVSVANFENFYFWVADSLNPVPEKRKCIFVDNSIEKEGVGYHR